MHLTALDDAAWDSPWRNVRVSAKVALCVGLVLTALVAPAWPGSVLVGAASIWLAVGPARIPLRVLAVAMAGPTAFLAAAAVPLALTAGTLSVGVPGVVRAVEALAHAFAGTLAVVLLATTTPMVDLLGWLRSCGIPAPLVDVASLTYRLLFVLLATTVSLREAQRARLGDAPGGGWAGVRRGWDSAASLAGSVLVRSWDRAVRLQAGLEGRGYVDDLHTLPATHPRSAPFIVRAVATLAAIWVVTLATTLLSPIRIVP